MTPAYEQAINIINGLTGAQTKATVATKAHAEAQTVLGASMGKVETATNAAARTFSALGIETGTATARVTMLTEALTALGSAAPQLIILGTVLLGIGAAVGFVKDAIGGAAAMETNLNTLGVAIKNQGGDWEKTRGSVEKWSEALESATIYSRTEAVDAMNDLVTAGISEADAQKMVTIATDVASGSHRSLIEVVDALKSAEAGRGMALVRIDENLKKVIASHGSLHDVLVVLAHDFSGQASAATDTFEGKQKVLHNTIESVAVTLGTALLPELEEGADVLIALADTLKQNGSAFEQWAKTAGGAIQDVYTLLFLDVGKGTKRLLDRMAPPDPNAPDLTRPGHTLGEQRGQATVETGPTGNIGIDQMIAANRVKRLADQKKFWAEYVQHELDALDKNVTMGKEQKAKAAKVEKAPPSLIELPDVEKTNAVVAAQSALKVSLATLSDSEKTLKDDVALSTTEQGKASAELALRTQVVKDAKQAIIDITAQEKLETAETDRLTAVHKASRTAMESLAASHNNVAQMEGDHSAALKILQRDYNAALKAWNDSGRVLATLATQHEANVRLIADETVKTNALAEANAKVALAMDKTGIEYAKKNQEEIRSFADEEATYKKSIAQQTAYYQQRLDFIKSSGTDTYNETNNLHKKILELDVEAYKLRVDAADAYVQAVQQKEKGVLDDLLKAHKSARDELKTVYDDIKNSFIEMAEQMLLKSALFEQMPGIFGTLMGGGTTGALGGKKAPKNTLGGYAGSIPNPFGSMGGGASGPAGTANDPLYVAGSPALLSALTGSNTGLFSGAGNGSGVPIIPAASLVTGGGSGVIPGFDFALPAGTSAGALAASQMPTGIFGAGGSWLNTAGMSSATDATSNDLTVMGPNGPITNSASASYTSGASTGSRIIGGLGGAAMTVAGYKQGGLSGGLEAGIGTYEMENAINPLLANSPIGLGIAAASGLVAGLIHHDNQSLMPDKYNTQEYGQGLANITGAAGASGQSFLEDPTLKTSLGGLSELGAIAQYIKSTGGSGFTAQQMQEFKGVTSIDPGSLHNGNLTANTGEVQNWQTWISDVNAAMQTVTAGGGVPSFTMTATYPGLSGGAITNPATYSAGAGSGAAGLRHTAGAVVVADFSNATIIGPGGMDTAAVAIGQSLNRVATGQAAGAPQNSLSNVTFRGDF
jgi:hypothetical protein